MPEKSSYLPTSREHRPEQRHNDKVLKSRRWQNWRNELLLIHKRACAMGDRAICEECMREGKPYAPQKVDLHHKIPRHRAPELTFARSNVEFLCKHHHTYATIRERLECGRSRRYVICGPPGSGKSTMAKRLAGDDPIWDADVVARELGMGEYPRSAVDSIQLSLLRDEFLAALSPQGACWIIVMRPNTAYAIAREIDASVIELHGNAGYRWEPDDRETRMSE